MGQFRLSFGAQAIGGPLGFASGELSPMSGPTNAENGLSCPQCATARDIYRYCMNCGFDFASTAEDFSPPTLAASASASASASEGATTLHSPGEALSLDDTDTAERPAVGSQAILPPPPDPSPPGSQLVGGTSAPMMVGIIAGAICLLLVLGAAIVSVLGDDDGQPADSASQGPNSPGTEESPTASAIGEECWDGTTADTQSECPIPTGTAGLAWVFPSFSEPDCTDKTKGAKPTNWTCAISVSGGGKVRVRYREHKSVDRPLAAFNEEFGVRNRTAVLSPREDVERYIWQSPTASNTGKWLVSSMYAEHPWSVTVKGRSPVDVETVFVEVVEFRNPRRIPH
jgi:hypothetical protein